MSSVSGVNVNEVQNEGLMAIWKQNLRKVDNAITDVNDTAHSVYENTKKIPGFFRCTGAFEICRDGLPFNVLGSSRVSKNRK